MGIDEHKNDVNISSYKTADINYYETLIKESPELTGSKERIYKFTDMKRKIRELILKRDDYTCQRCLEKTNPHYTRGYRGHIDIFIGSSIVAHHIIPRDMDGSDHPSNMVTLCKGCHHEIHYYSKKLKKEDKKFLNLGKDVKITFPPDMILTEEN